MKKNLTATLRNRLFYRDSLITAIVAMILFALLVFVFQSVNTHVADPVTTALKDFEFSDLYFGLHRNAKAAPDPRIVLINTGADRPSFRRDLGRMIKIVSRFEPAVIAVDHYFPEGKTSSTHDDSILADAIKSWPGLISACTLRPEAPEGEVCKRASDEQFGIAHEGYHNVVADSSGSVRFFMPYVRIEKNGKKTDYESFALKAVRHFTPDSVAYRDVYAHCDGKNAEWINYTQRDDNWYEFSDLLKIDTAGPSDSRADDSTSFDNAVRGKIILFGFLGIDRNTKTLEDLYMSPIDKFKNPPERGTYGLQIHASIISTMLNREYIRVAPSFVLVAVGFLLCWLAVMLLLYIYIQHPAFFHAWARFVQITLSLTVVIITLLILEKYHLEIGAKLILTPALICTEAVYFTDFIMQVIRRKTPLNTFYSHEH